MAIEELLEGFARDAAGLDRASLTRHVDELDELIEDGRGPSRDQADRLLLQLRNQRYFSTMLDVANLLDGELSPMGRIYQAQAHIDTGRLGSPVVRKLKNLKSNLVDGKLDDELPKDPSERQQKRRKLVSETNGLLGRLFKQRFVDAHRDGEGEAAEALTESMAHYQEGYALDPAWHGPNLAALAWRAERERFDLGKLPRAATTGRELEARQVALGDLESLSPWDLSALAQAKMAQGQWDEGLLIYGMYARKLDHPVGPGAAFTLAGDLRQLQEIWLIDEEGDGPRDRILTELAQRILEGGGAKVSLTPNAAAMINRYTTDGEIDHEANQSGGDTYFLVRDVDRLNKQAESVCRLRGKPGVDGEGKGGTGFLVEGKVMGMEDDHIVLVTASHVVSRQPLRSSTLHQDDAEALFERWGKPVSLEIDSILWESPSDAFDVSVCRLRGIPEEARGARVFRRASPYPPPFSDPSQEFGRVVPIGYPGGKELTYTFGSNAVLDHDLHRDLGTPRVVHYEADTDYGSSGGPVFTPGGQVVAIHLGSTKQGVAGSPKGVPGAYRANVGRGIYAAMRACLERRA